MTVSAKEANRRKTIVGVILAISFFVMMIVPAFFGGAAPGGVKISKAQHMAHPPIDIQALTNVINPPGGYVLPVQYSQLGPKLLAAGVIDVALLQQDYKQTGRLLSEHDKELLSQGSQEQVVINQNNAAFLLTLFWGFGLANQNPITEKVSIQLSSNWVLGRKPGTDLISSAAIYKLTSDQQARLEEVAKGIYRPCSDVSTFSPDSQQSIAMLGFLEFMASQNVSSDDMFTAAKQINAFWFPQQTLEQALFFIATQLKNYENIDARVILSQQYFSASGFEQIHQWLKDYHMVGDESTPELNCTQD
jgi:hypothetical protein